MSVRQEQGLDREMYGQGGLPRENRVGTNS